MNRNPFALLLLVAIIGAALCYRKAEIGIDLVNTSGFPIFANMRFLSIANDHKSAEILAARSNPSTNDVRIEYFQIDSNDISEGDVCQYNEPDMAYTLLNVYEAATAAINPASDRGATTPHLFVRTKVDKHGTVSILPIQMKTLTIDTPFAVERALQEYLSAMPHEKNPISFFRALSPETTEKLRAQWRPTTLFDTFEDLQRTVLSDSDARRAANTSSASTAARARTTKTDNLTAIWVEEVQKTIRKATFAACSECAAKHKDPTLTAMTRECLEAQHPQILTDCGKKARDFFTQLTDDHDIANVETVARPGNLTGPDGEDMQSILVPFLEQIVPELVPECQKKWHLQEKLNAFKQFSDALPWDVKQYATNTGPKER
ncbi:hypothetical protein J8273_2389 [Carpediemonas membranifera]|uniref:Uncharacterized protein n=1 Tax=Carpediemonas membranifera TaxID=201153 RepID=A0A8J6E5N6_9EUKA|nr:hypothetical protein J8273_2389 [Carpediemonas membranifera]|eukprot:KAG9396037.1 hypothetical protein J8273_2389 [Carpediemonas membranifera]